jgi:LPS-assembly protein
VLASGVASYGAETIEVSAEYVEGSGTKVHAKNGVVVHYGDAIIRADRATYDKANHLLSLDGNVEMIGYKGTKEHASHIDIDTKTDEVRFKELFYTNANDIWLLTHHADKKDGNYTFGPSVLSSCDINDPIWKMRFSSSKYDSGEKYMRLYDTTVYMWDIPVFYSPYLAFSTDNKRKSGLLFPRFGYTREEGFIYEQPIFWAISDSMDLEFNPQIRTDRSVGMYATYRFVDSPVSYGQLRVGYFKDKEEYAKSHNLPEDKHYGLQFVYNRDEVLAKQWGETYKDGLYIDVTLLNDIDYLNLQKSGNLGIFGQSPIQQSILNYYIDNNEWYGGINAKYFIDTRLPDNDTTIQTLPSIQAHKYVSHIVWDNLTYSLDFQIRNFYRKDGVDMRQAEMRVPIEFTTSFFDDYLSLTLGESLFFGKYFFGNDNTLAYDDFQYANNMHSVKLFSDLTGKIGDYIHVIQPSVSYILPGSESTAPVSIERMLREQPQIKNLFSVGLPEEQAVFALNQYLYDDTMHLIFFQRLSQRYYPDRAYETADLENEMGYFWKAWRFYNNLVYSFEFDDIRESASFVSYKGDHYFVSLGHTYKQEFLTAEESTILSNDIQFDFSYALNNKVSLSGRWNYDLEERGLDRWSLGGDYKRDCWSIYAFVGADVRPRPTTDTGTVEYTQEYSFYLQLDFTPFGSINTSSLTSAFSSNDAF